VLSPAGALAEWTRPKHQHEDSRALFGGNTRVETGTGVNGGAVWSEKSTDPHADEKPECHCLRRRLLLRDRIADGAVRWVGEAGQRMPWLRRGLQMYAKELKCRGHHCLRAGKSVADVECVRPVRVVDDASLQVCSDGPKRVLREDATVAGQGLAT
jgi:hypothetical protein